MLCSFVFFCFVFFCFVLCCFVLFCLLFCFVLFCFVLFCLVLFVLFCFVLFVCLHLRVYGFLHRAVKALEKSSGKAASDWTLKVGND